MLGNVDELDPLLFRCCFPPGKPPLVEGFDNLIKGILWFVATVNSARIRILRIKLGIAGVEADSLLQLYPFQAVG